MRFAPTIFRPAFGRVLSVIVVVIAATGIAGYILAGDLTGLVRYGWGPLLLAAVALALFWFPRIGVAEHEVTVRNVFSTVHLPWPAITLVDTKWALTLHTDDRK
ncbi:MAG: PH domain-containing protein, partial [Rhodoglobus sp.]|nr:PH domain-containing protein [Rhodoglobus sp.]